LFRGKGVNLKVRLFVAVWQSIAILAMAAVLAFTVNHFRKDRLPLVGDWSPKGELRALKTSEDAIVSIEEARALFLTGGAIFFDARSPEDYQAGHIQGALNLPAQNFDEFYPGLLPEITPDSLIITYCDGETCELSKDLAFALSAKGYSHVRVLVNGWSSWRDATLPVETGR